MTIRFLLFVLLAATTGCTTCRDVTHTAPVREAGIVGKTYKLVQPGYLICGKQKILAFELQGHQERLTQISPGTCLHVVGVKKIGNLKFTHYKLMVEILDGIHQGDGVLLDDGFFGNPIPAIARIEFFAPPEADVPPDLAYDLLRSTHGPTRFAAADAIRLSRPTEPKFIRAVAEHLPHEADPDVRWRLIHALDERLAREVIPLLIELLHKHSLQLVEEMRVVELIGAQGVTAVPLIQVALTALQPDQRKTFHRLLWVMVRIGPDAQPAVPQLLAARRRVRDTSLNYYDLLTEIDPRAAALELLERLDSDRPDERRRALSDLARLGDEAIVALPVIEHLARHDPNPEIRSIAAKLAQDLNGQAGSTR